MKRRPVSEKEREKDHILVHDPTIVREAAIRINHAKIRAKESINIIMIKRGGLIPEIHPLNLVMTRNRY